MSTHDGRGDANPSQLQFIRQVGSVLLCAECSRLSRTFLWGLSWPCLPKDCTVAITRPTPTLPANKCMPHLQSDKSRFHTQYLFLLSLLCWQRASLAMSPAASSTRWLAATSIMIMAALIPASLAQMAHGGHGGSDHSGVAVKAGDACVTSPTLANCTTYSYPLASAAADLKRCATQVHCGLRDAASRWLSPGVLTA